MTETGSHQSPFYCPYCGEEDIRPFGERPGDWGCAACRRVWTLRYVGVSRGRPGRPADEAETVGQPAERSIPAGAVSGPGSPQGERVATTPVRPEERGPDQREERAALAGVGTVGQ